MRLNTKACAEQLEHCWWLASLSDSLTLNDSWTTQRSIWKIVSFNVSECCITVTNRLQQTSAENILCYSSSACKLNLNAGKAGWLYRHLVGELSGAPSTLEEQSLEAVHRNKWGQGVQYSQIRHPGSNTLIKTCQESLILGKMWTIMAKFLAGEEVLQKAVKLVAALFPFLHKVCLKNIRIICCWNWKHERNFRGWKNPGQMNIS